MKVPFSEDDYYFSIQLIEYPKDITFVRFVYYWRKKGRNRFYRMRYPFSAPIEVTKKLIKKAERKGIL